MITWSAIPSSSAGPDTAGPTSTSTIGHDARRVGERLGHPAPRVQRRHALRRRRRPSWRSARRSACRARPRGAPPARWSRPRRCRSRPRCLPPSRLNQLTGRPSISRTSAATAALRCPKTGVAVVRPCVTRRGGRPAPGSGWRCGRRTRTSSTAPACARSAGGCRPRRRGRCRRRSARGWRWAARCRRAARAG